MSKKKLGIITVAIAVIAVASVIVVNKMPKSKAAQNLSNNATGTEDGYDYELWKDSGNTSMTLNGGGKFSCQWSNINNALFRKGKKLGSNKTYSEVGNISIKYGCDYNPSGNSYLGVYGWTTDPLVEYYIVDSWGTWRPPGTASKGTITVDGGTYEVYESTRTNQPSIEGTKTFKQYWSVRTSKRTSGTISVSEHFKEWEKLGLNMGKMYEVALNVEGYQSSGQANVYENDIAIGGSSNSSSASSEETSSINETDTNNSPSTGTGTEEVASSSSSKTECEDMSFSGKYASMLYSPFSGAGLYANDDACKFKYNFESETNSFTLKGCSNNSEVAEVDLKIDGETVGTFSCDGSNPAEYTLDNINTGTGEKTVELVLSTDDDSWDAYLDYLSID